MFQAIFGAIETQKTSTIVIPASADGHFSARSTLDLGLRRCEALAAYRNHCRMRLMFPGLVFVHKIGASATDHKNASPEQDLIFACTRWRHNDQATDTAVERCVQAVSKKMTERGRNSVSYDDLGGTDFRSVLQRHSDSDRGRTWYLVLREPMSRTTAAKRPASVQDTANK